MKRMLPAWYVYLAECKDGTLYSGITTDPVRRMKEHNGSKKGARYTHARRPVILRFKKRYPDRSTASKAEYALKQRSRAEKITLIKSSEKKK